jgi:hypothetical protein
MPILPGKKAMWLEMMEQVKTGPMAAEFKKSREDAGVHERSFLQETPHGDFVILTFEGENPTESFGKIMGQMDADFAAFAAEVHGMDAEAAPSIPTLVFDSRA